MLWPAVAVASILAAFARADDAGPLVVGGEALGHQSWVYALAFTPDGRHLVSGSYDSTVRVWDVASRRLVRTIPANHNSVTSVALDPGGGWIASGGRDNLVRLWDLETGAPRGVLRGHTDWVYAVAVSPDGRQVVSGSRDRTVRLWDVETGKVLWTFRGHKGVISSVAMTPDGEYVVSGSGGDRNAVVTGGDGTVRVWNARTGAAVHELRGHKDGVSALAVTVNGTRVVSASYDGTCKLWDVVRGRLLRDLAKTDKMLAVAVDGHGQRAFCLSEGNGVHVAELGRSASAGRLSTGGVGLALSPEGRVLAVGGTQDIALWDVATGRRLGDLASRTSEVYGMALSPDGAWVAAGGNLGTLRVYDIESGAVRHELSGHRGIVFSLAFHPSGRYLVSGSSDHEVAAWDMESGQPLRKFLGHADAVRAVAVSQDGTLLASGGDDQTLRVWDFWSGEQKHVLKHAQEAPLWVRFLPEGPLLAAAWNNALTAWDPASGRELRHVETTLANFLGFEVLGDGVLLGAWDRSLRVLDPLTGQVRRLFPAEKDWVRTLGVDAPRRRVAGAGVDKKIRVWTMEGDLLATLEGHTEAPRHLAFTPDGRSLVSAGDDTIRVWDIERARETRRFHFVRAETDPAPPPAVLE